MQVSNKFCGQKLIDKNKIPAKSFHLLYSRSDSETHQPDLDSRALKKGSWNCFKKHGLCLSQQHKVDWQETIQPDFLAVMNQGVNEELPNQASFQDLFTIPDQTF